MNTMRRKCWALWAMLFGLCCPAACGTSGVVGGHCAAGYLECKGHCVAAEHDRANCGACDNHCAEGLECRRGVCSSDTEAGAGSSGDAGSIGDAGASGADAGSGGASGSIGESGAANNGGGSGEIDRPDAGDELDAGDASDATPDAADACVPPYDRPSACGSCGTACVAPTSDCAPDGMGSYVCVPRCVAPMQECGGQCFDYNIDSNNCGSCRNACASSICQGGQCAGAYVGHVVLACMNFQNPVRNTAPIALLGNSVLLPLRNPVRILGYTEFASAATRAKVDQAIGYAASARGRTFTITQLADHRSATATLNIADYDVFLIYDQNTAAPGELANTGASFQSSSVLTSFAAAGGVIIGLSGGTGEMPEFFTSSGLLPVSGQTLVSNSTVYNRASADALGVNVISPFLAPVESCTFTTNVTPDSDNIFVVRNQPTGLGAPVVVHRVIEP